MILITQDESFKLRKMYPDVSIYRTLKQRSKRGKYYAEESMRVLAFIKEERNRNIVEHFDSSNKGDE